MRRILLALTLITLPSALVGQTLNLRDLLTASLRDGIRLAPPATGFSHEAHFIGDDSPQFLALQQFTLQLATQVSSYPLPSSAGGFTYEYDPALGVFNRASESFGPIYAERANTIGKGKFNLGFGSSHVSFDKFDELSLREGDTRLVFTHIDVNNDDDLLKPFFEGDVITAELFLKVESDTQLILMTYGLTDRIDITAVVPFVKVSLESQTNAHVQRLGSGTTSTIHTFTNGRNTDTITRKGSASGVGDILLHAKVRAFDLSKWGVAFGADLRLPTGEELDLLGTGSTQIKPSVIASLKGPFSPHVNLGYAWYSGGDFKPADELDYTVGFDWAIAPKLTLAADIIGRNFIDSRRISVEDTTFVANTNTNSAEPPTLVNMNFPRLLSTQEDVNTLTGALGVKINPFGTFLLTVNGLFSLSEDGLQTRFSPLISVDYSF